MLDVLFILLVFLTSVIDCKYCWHTNKFGKSKHFYCGAFEYCCGDRCCENFEEFYKLWYFWLCVMVLILTSCVALYWLKRRYQVHHLFEHRPDALPRRSRRRRRSSRYRQLTGESNSGPAVVVPESVITAPPPYSGDGTCVPHGGPPPYTLGSGSSINSTTMPRCPPSYNDIEKQPPPSYSSITEEVVTINPDIILDSKKSPDNQEGPS